MENRSLLVKHADKLLNKMPIKNVISYIFLCLALILGVSCKPEKPPEIQNTAIENREKPENFPILVQDFEGNTVSLKSAAKRIIALAPHIVENLFTVGLGTSIVGVVSHSDFPEKAKSLPIIGHHNGISTEKILSINPDLVIAWSSGTNSELIEKLKLLNIPVYLDNPKSLQSITKSLNDFATMGGINYREIGDIRSYSKKINNLQTKYASRAPLSVFVPIGEKPLRTLSGKHIVSDMISGCGGNNIFSELAAIAPTVNYESFLERAPQVILIGGKTKKQAKTRLKDLRIDFLDARIHLQDERENKKTFKPYTIVIDPDILYRHTIRMAEAMEILCEGMDSIRNRLSNKLSKN